MQRDEITQGMRVTKTWPQPNPPTGTVASAVDVGGNFTVTVDGLGPQCASPKLRTDHAETWHLSDTEAIR